MSGSEQSRKLCASAPCFHPRNPNLVKRRTTTSSEGSPSASGESSLVTSPTSNNQSPFSAAAVTVPSTASPNSMLPPPPYTTTTSTTGSSSDMRFPAKREFQQRVAPPAWVPPQQQQEPYPATLTGLGQEMVDLLRYAALTAAEQQARQDFVGVVRSVANKLWSGKCRVVPFGSFALGLSTPMSDVDIAIVMEQPSTQLHLTSEGSKAATEEEEDEGEGAAGRELTDEDPSMQLHTLSEALSQIGLSVSVIDQCRVPVLQVLQPWSGLRCDVSVTLRRPEEVVAQQLIWLDKVPHARTLIMMTKLALQQWGLNSLFTGGISSTCVYSLVHRFLMESIATSPQECPLLEMESGAARMMSPHPPPAATMSLSLKSQGLGLQEEDSSEGGSCGMSPAETSDADETTTIPSSATSTPSSGTATAASITDDDLTSFLPSTPPTSQEQHSAPPPVEFTAELLLQFWRYCGSDFFQGGYLIEDAFSLTDTNNTSSSASSSLILDGTSRPVKPKKTRPNDLSKASFRLGEALFLFQHSADVIGRMLRPVGSPIVADRWLMARGGKPWTTLSSVFADPRVALQQQQRLALSSFTNQQALQKDATAPPPPPPPPLPSSSSASEGAETTPASANNGGAWKKIVSGSTTSISSSTTKAKTAVKVSSAATATKTSAPRNQQAKRKRAPVLTH